MQSASLYCDCKALGLRRTQRIERPNMVTPGLQLWCSLLVRGKRQRVGAIFFVAAREQRPHERPATYCAMRPLLS